MQYQKNRINWLKKFTKGLKLDGLNFGIKLFGGDLSVSPKIFLSATILGLFVEKNFHKHSKAIEGSEIYIGGNIGTTLISRFKSSKKNIKLHKKVFF